MFKFQVVGGKAKTNPGFVGTSVDNSVQRVMVSCNFVVCVFYLKDANCFIVCFLQDVDASKNISTEPHVSTEPNIEITSSKPSTVSDINRDANFSISYAIKKKPTYAHATQPHLSTSSMRPWKPPGFVSQPLYGFGVYTDLSTSNMILNVSKLIPLPI